MAIWIINGIEPEMFMDGPSKNIILNMWPTLNCRGPEIGAIPTKGDTLHLNNNGTKLYYRLTEINESLDFNFGGKCYECFCEPIEASETNEDTGGD